MVGRSHVVVAAFRPRPGTAAAVAGLASKTVVVDDGSPCAYDRTLADIGAAPGTTLRRLPRNRGIAAALAVGITAARSAGCAWVLTLDQDSTVPDGFLDALVAVADAASAAGLRVGAVAPAGYTTGGQALTYPTRSRNGIPVTTEVLQSGTLWSLDALDAIGGPDESLVIDAVDTDLCMRLQRAGYAIVVAPDVVLEHRLGDATPRRFLGRTVLQTRHSPLRRYYLTRNRLLVTPETARVDVAHALRSLRRVAVDTVVELTYGPRRSDVAIAVARGVLDAARARRGRLRLPLRDRLA